MSFFAVALPVIGTAVGIGGSLGLFGGDDGGGTPSGDAASAIANDMYGSTAKSRGNFIDIFDQLTSGKRGGYDIASHPAFAPMKQTIESQYQNAEDNIMGQTAPGGQLRDLLAQNEMSRAGSFGAVSGDIMQDMLNKAYGASFNAPQAALAGLQTGQYGEMFGQQQNQQMWGDIGNFVGGDLPTMLNSLGGMFGGGGSKGVSNPIQNPTGWWK